MTKKVRKILTKSLAALAYVTPIGIGIWQTVRGKRSAANPKKQIKKAASAGVNAESENNKPSKPAAPEPQQKLESLSLSTPGDAPLDRLARTAVSEKQNPRQPEPSGLETAVPPGSASPRPPEDESVSALLNDQSLESGRLEGWNLPVPRRLPVPTYAPAVMAFGIVVFAMGLATIWYVCVMGSLVFAVAAWRWVGELQGE
ncbi:MAG: hypothetical protein WA324_27945 [Bryobacteraceae bacterium]